MSLNDLLNFEKNPSKSILAVCDDESTPKIKEFLKDFENKTFRLPDGLKDLSGSLSDSIVVHLPTDQITAALLEELVELGAQGSSLTILNIIGDTGDLKFMLTTTGYTNIVVKDFNSKPSITAFKPGYQIGSSAKLNFQKTATAAAVWKLDDDLNDEVETIDPDNLLDEDDLKKPDPSSLKVCGTTGKRKACKDCSCGLAEELEVEAKAGAVVDTGNAPKSSCGSCYLGDAFRCASCPYLGMPAFKPGDKIQISDNLLKADI